MKQLYYSHNLNPRLAVAVARHLRSPVEFIRARPFHPSQIEAFRKLNPNTRVPVLVEDGRSLWETDAIACRLSELAASNFWRRDREMVEMIRWVSWAAYHLNRAAGEIYFDSVVRPAIPAPFTPPALAHERRKGYLDDFRGFAAILDAHLSHREWLLDGGLCYADFRVAAALPFADAAGLPLADFPAMARWHRRLLALDAWRAPFEGLEAA